MSTKSEQFTVVMGRSGEYRILYEIDYDARIVTVFRIINRGEGY